MRQSTANDENTRHVWRDADSEQPALPGLESFGPLLREMPTYLCVACWRQIPVGVHAHACFFSE